MSKRFRAEIDWHDSGWIYLTESLAFSMIRYVGPFTLSVSLLGTMASIRIDAERIYLNEYANKHSAALGCERALRRLLK